MQPFIEKSHGMAHMLCQSNRERCRMDVIQLLQQMIQARSYSGEEKEVVNVINKAMENLGFDKIEIDEYGNIVGFFYGKEEGPVQLYDAHVDTVVVPNPDKWQHDPFGGVIEQGRIYGRGTSDMKGALAAMMMAASKYAHGNRREFKGTIAVAGIVHEECFEGVAARAMSKRVQPNIVVIGEASSLNVKHGQRGRAEVVVETFGKPAHSANPQHGINAVYQMSEAIGRIRTLEPPVQETLGEGILTLTDIQSSPYPGASVVPDYCKATWDRRLLVGETKESVLQPIQEILNSLDEQEGRVQVRYAKEEVDCYTGVRIGDERFFPGWYYEADETFVRVPFEALTKAGFDCTLTCYDFCTNGSHYAGEAGIPTIGFGPSEEYLAHTMDEYIEVEQLQSALEGYMVIMDALSTLDL